jgi:hypothetical protein
MYAQARIRIGEALAIPEVRSGQLHVGDRRVWSATVRVVENRYVVSRKRWGCARLKNRLSHVHACK